jgi:hypothetical protein
MVRIVRRAAIWEMREIQACRQAPRPVVFDGVIDFPPRQK